MPHRKSTPCPLLENGSCLDAPNPHPRVHRGDSSCCVLILFIQSSATPGNTTSFCLKGGKRKKKKGEKGGERKGCTERGFLSTPPELHSHSTSKPWAAAQQFWRVPEPGSAPQGNSQHSVKASPWDGGVGQLEPTFPAQIPACPPIAPSLCLPGFSAHSCFVKKCVKTFSGHERKASWISDASGFQFFYF